MNTCAKINLFLKVVGKRQDGYHDLENIFLPIVDWNDTVIVRKQDKPGIEIYCDHPDVPRDGSNLCAKATREFCLKAGMPPAHRILIEKRIPIAAGLGGGSSDAAATLLQLNAIHGHPLDVSALHGIASAIGADVPFFLNPRPALGTGIGTELKPLTLAAKLHLVIAAPGFPITAKWAFEHCKFQHAAPSLEDIVKQMESTDPAAIAKLAQNDLEHAILDKFPLLALIREAFLTMGATCAHVSGSGPTIYAIVPPELQERISAGIQTQFQSLTTLSVHSSTINPTT